MQSAIIDYTRPYSRLRVIAPDVRRLGTQRPFLFENSWVDLAAQGDALVAMPNSAGRAAYPEALLAAPAPHILVTHDASSLLMHLPAAMRQLPWISMAKISSLSWVTATDHAITAIAGRHGLSGGADDDTAPLLAAILLDSHRRGMPLRRAILLTQAILPPVLPLPGLEDDMSWALVADDVLRGLVFHPSDFPRGTVGRGRREIFLRRVAGHEPDFRVRNWTLPGLPDDDDGATWDTTRLDQHGG